MGRKLATALRFRLFRSSVGASRRGHFRPACRRLLVFFFALSFVMKWSCVLRRQRRNVPHGTGLAWKCAWFRRCRGPHATLDSSRNVWACPRMTTMCSCYEHFPAFSSSVGARPKITNFKPSVFVSIFLHEQRLQLFTVSWTDKGS